MKKLFIALLSITVLFSACEKEEEVTPTPIPTPVDPVDPVENDPFSCKIEGVAFADNTPVVKLTTDDLMTITATASNGDFVSLKIIAFSSRNAGDVLEFNYYSMGQVNKGGVLYNNASVPYGNITIETINTTSGKISGTFYFKGEITNDQINITDGEFNVSL